MAIAVQHQGIVGVCSILAAIVGLIFGWAPGADLGFLGIIWTVGFLMILFTSPLAQIKWVVLRLFVALMTAGLIIGFGVEVVTKLTLPIYWIVNPILNALATYRILRTASKLFASDDSEEFGSNVFANIIAIIGLIFTDNQK